MNIKPLQRRLLALPIWAKLLLAPFLVVTFMVCAIPAMLGLVLITFYEEAVSGRMFEGE